MFMLKVVVLSMTAIKIINQVKINIPAFDSFYINTIYQDIHDIQSARYGSIESLGVAQ